MPRCRWKALTVTQYIAELPAERQVVIKKLRHVLKKNLPKGFAETMAYGMLGYVVPLRRKLHPRCGSRPTRRP